MIKVPPIAFQAESLILTYDLNLQCYESYDHNPYTWKSQRSLDSSDCITCRANTVGNMTRA